MYFGLYWKEPRLQINSTAVDEYKGSNIDGFNVPISINYLDYFWIPDLEIFGLSGSESSSLHTPMAGLKVARDKILRLNSRVRLVLSCEMNFDLYPFDSHECVLHVSSFSHHKDIVDCTSKFDHCEYCQNSQRSLGYKIQYANLSSGQKSFTYHGNDWRGCGFRIFLKRDLTKFVLTVYFTSTLCVILTWGSFILSPKSISERMAMIVTVFIGLIFILIGIKSSSPSSTGLNAVDLYLVVCIGYVFAAWFESVLASLFYRQPEWLSKLGPSCSRQVRVENRSDPSSNTDENGLDIREPSHVIDQNDSRSRIDSISLKLFPATFAIFITLYLICYSILVTSHTLSWK